MKNKKTCTALVRQPKPAPRIIEEILSVSFENGGRLNFTVTKDSLGECLATLNSALSSTPLDKTMSMCLTFNYWRLDDEFDEINILICADEFYFGELPPADQIVRKLAELCKSRFLKSLVKNSVTLRGRLGQLVNSQLK